MSSVPSGASPDETGPTFVPSRSGTVLDFLAVTPKLTSLQTGGSIYLFEAAFEPGAGNRMHVHGREDEIGFVIDGALEVRLADRSEILQWLSTIPSAPKKVCLVHGETGPMDSLKAEIERRFGWPVVTPTHGETLAI